jgi:hypothetical protein
VRRDDFICLYSASDDERRRRPLEKDVRAAAACRTPLEAATGGGERNGPFFKLGELYCLESPRRLPPSSLSPARRLLYALAIGGSSSFSSTALMAATEKRTTQSAREKLALASGHAATAAQTNAFFHMIKTDGLNGPLARSRSPRSRRRRRGRRQLCCHADATTDAADADDSVTIVVVRRSRFRVVAVVVDGGLSGGAAVALFPLLV